MASLAAIQKVFPEAATVAGRVILFHKGKHYDLGAYVGDGAVVLTKEGEELLFPPEQADKPVAKRAGKPAVQQKGGLQLDDVEV